MWGREETACDMSSIEADVGQRGNSVRYVLY
jgi:hypothetical protein